MAPKARLQARGGNIAILANGNGKDTSNIRGRLKSERLSSGAEIELENPSDHGGSRQDVSRTRVADPRGQNVYTRSEDSDLCSEIGEIRHNVVGVSSANSVCGPDVGRRVT